MITTSDLAIIDKRGKNSDLNVFKTCLSYFRVGTFRKLPTFGRKYITL